MLDPRIGCDNDDAARFASNDAEKAAAEILATTEGGNDDGNIVLGGVGWRACQRDRLERPRGDTADNQASVTPEPGKECWSATTYTATGR